MKCVACDHDLIGNNCPMHGDLTLRAIGGIRWANEGDEKGAAPRAEGLDVERLTRVLQTIHGDNVPLARGQTPPREYAEMIVMVDATLSRLSDKPCTRFRHDEHCANRHWGKDEAGEAAEDSFYNDPERNS